MIEFTQEWISKVTPYHSVLANKILGKRDLKEIQSQNYARIISDDEIVHRQNHPLLSLFERLEKLDLPQAISQLKGIGKNFKKIKDSLH